MDICIVTSDNLLARSLILELEAAGFSAMQSMTEAEEARLNIFDLDSFTGEIPSGGVGFSYSDANSKLVHTFLPRPISVATFLGVVKERLSPSHGGDVGLITVDSSTRRVKTDRGEVRLSEKELALLILLCREKTLSREKAGNIFGDGESNIVDVYMHYLRKKLKIVCPYDVIESKRAEGYSVVYPVEII